VSSTCHQVGNHDIVPVGPYRRQPSWHDEICACRFLFGANDNRDAAGWNRNPIARLLSQSLLRSFPDRTPHPLLAHAPGNATNVNHVRCGSDNHGGASMAIIRKGLWIAAFTVSGISLAVAGGVAGGVGGAAAGGAAGAAGAAAGGAAGAASGGVGGVGGVGSGTGVGGIGGIGIGGLGTGIGIGGLGTAQPVRAP
jgi:hypothetical protein